MQLCTTVIVVAIIGLNSFKLEVKACHVAGHVRERRQTTTEIDISKDVREYFASCLRDKVGDIWVWESVVDYSVLDTYWYDNSDNFNCSASIDFDTSECWKERITIYLRNSSFLVPPCHDCIDEFGTDTSQGVRTYTVANIGNLITANRYELCIVPDSTQPFRPNSPRIRQYSSCNSNNVEFSASRTPLDFPSVFQFIESHTTCGSEFRECDANNQAVITQTNPDITRWPYRYDALTLDDSPLKSAIGLCNEKVYPPEVANWSQWSSCSATCGGGERTRGLNCNGAKCASTTVQTCNTNLCPECSISLPTRQRCGNAVSSKQECLNRGCCYETGFCYRKGKMSLFMQFTPSVQPNAPFGGEPGFPGSSVIRCDRILRGRTCMGGNVDRMKCARVGCCWDQVTSTCYRGSYKVTHVRQSCPPGFSNPPRCDDINECSASPCMNGGTCHNRINGFLCDCPVTTFGPTCGLTCPSPPSPINGFFDPVSTVYQIDDTVIYACNPPYILDGDLFNDCLSTGTWSNAAPHCKLICGTPPLSSNLFYSPIKSTYDVNEVVTYSCPSGYDIVGVITNNLCHSEGWLYDTAPLCVLPAMCGTPPVSSNLLYSLIKSTYDLNEVVTYSCPTGYDLIGVTTINVCRLAGWMYNTAPMCMVTPTCGVPPTSNFVVYSPPQLSFVPSETVMYTCIAGYTIQGITSNECLVTGWAFTAAPECTPICTNPPVPDNGFFTSPIFPTPTMFNVGDTIQYQCVEPHILFSGPTSNTCIGPEMWTSSLPPSCIVVCFQPPTPVDGSHMPVQSTYNVGITVMYFCGVDVPLNGPNTNMCQNDGSWLNGAPTCG